jgi:hypothetical protein
MQSVSVLKQVVYIVTTGLWGVKDVCPYILISINIEQKYRTLYMKTYTRNSLNIYLSEKHYEQKM